MDAAGTYVLQVVSLGLGFLSQLVVARLVGISGYGGYSYALAWSAMVVQPSLVGLDRVLVRGLPTYRQARAFGLMRGLLRRSDQVAVVALCSQRSWPPSRCPYRMLRCAPASRSGCLPFRSPLLAASGWRRCRD